MGAKQSKNNHSSRSTPASNEKKKKNNNNNNKKRRNLRAVLSTSSSSKSNIKNQHPTPLACTTRHELPKQEHHHEENTEEAFETEKKRVLVKKEEDEEDEGEEDNVLIPNIATFATSPPPPPTTTTETMTTTLLSTNNNNNTKPSSSSKKRSTPPPAPSSSVTPLYDPASTKQRKSKRMTATPSSSTSNKHMSMISTFSELGYSNKSGLSSGWTTLSCDPFSQIEANTSAFTDITDHSNITLSRSSKSPFTDYSSVFQTTTQLHQAILDDYHLITTEKIIDALMNTHDLHQTLNKVFFKVQQQNDPEDWRHFYLAMSECANRMNEPMIHVFLARCFISGLGVTKNVEHGFRLLKAQPETCETTYALGHCYFNGITLQGTMDKVTAFDYFKKSASYDPTTGSSKETIAEAQCILARMLFQGDGVTQNSKEALHYLILSAENNNMYAQFLIGVHYEKGFDIAQDYEKAKYFYRKSADQGFADAQAALGIKLIAEGQYAQGVDWLQQAVEKGNSRAHVSLGILYEKGEGVPQSDETALYHYKAAVESDNCAAQYILGLILYFGRLGRQKNYKDGIRLIKQSAYAGFPYAQRVMGQLYQQGNVSVLDTNSPQADTRYKTKKNEKEAIRWYKRAVAGKDVLAMGILGSCYEHGTGVDVDYEKALSYYAKAAEQQGSPYVFHAQLSQALLLQKMARHTEAFRLYALIADQAERESHPYQIATLSVARYQLNKNIEGIPYHPVLAVNQLIALAETTQNPHAHYWLGVCYDDGVEDVCPVDRQKAFYHFKIAAEAGDNDATFLIAYMMSNHVIPDKGPADAFPWYQKAAAKGHRTSMYSLGLCYYKGIGVSEPNLELALEWFEKAARLGVADSMSYIGRIYLQKYIQSNGGNGNNELPFLKTALVWFKKAADRNDTYSQRELGKIYLSGKHVVEVDYDLAVNLLERAAQKNDPEAVFYLGDCYYKGTGVTKDDEVAVAHYMRAASLGYPLAYTAVAELYYNMGNMNLAYDHFLLASESPRIAHTKIGKNAKMMAARIALGYYHVSVIQLDTSLFMRPTEAFDILSTLSIQDQFVHAFQPLAFCYLNGNGTAANIMQALFWFRKSADELNDSVSYFQLAEMYGNGMEIHTDIELALTFLKKSADMGYPEAQFRMGIIYLQGEYGLPMDERTAMHWLRLAAGNAHAESMWTLSKLSGSIDQPELELQYQKSAAAMGHLLAMRTLGQKYLHLVDAPFTDALLIHAYLEEGLKYLHLAADRGDVESLVILGHTYANCTKTRVKFSNKISTQSHLPTPSDTHSFCNDGSIVDDDDDDEEEVDSKWQSEEDEKKLAIECFEQASALGDLNATVLAAEAWHEQKQYTAALEYFEKAASQGSVIARFFCARYCIEGHPGCPADPEKGFQELLICAQELNCVHAFNTLGQCYESGVGVEKNDQLAFQWYYRAAETTQDAEAYYRMGRMYAEERVPLTDHQLNKNMEAYKLYHLAVEASPESHGLACYELAMYNMNGIRDEHHRVLMPPDVCLAIEYLRTSADLNVTKAMLELALLFLNDDFPLEEQEEGFRRLAHAAELGLKEAQFELGRFYHLGKEVILVGGDDDDDHDDDMTEAEQQQQEKEDPEEEECVIIPQDFEKAYDLFCRSAAQKHPTATYYLGLYHQHGIFVAPDLSIALNQYEIAVQLFEHFEAAPERWQAEFNLACILHHDIESRHRAYELFQTAQLHAPEASKFLSKIMITRYHLYGWGGVSVQAEEAASTLLVFSQDEKYGYYVFLDIAHCYETGTGVAQDLHQAFYWYGEVVGKSHLVGDSEDHILDEEVEENEANAMFKLAEFYRNGWVVAQDLEKAEELYKLAAGKGSQAAQEYLSIMLQRTNIYD